MADERKKLDDFVHRIHDQALQWQTERFERSYFSADRDERRARLKIIVALSVELEKIRAVSIFSTGLGEAAIGDVVEGDFEGLGVWIDMFAFTDEDEETQKQYGPLWEGFRAILVSAREEARVRHGGVPGASA